MDRVPGADGVTCCDRPRGVSVQHGCTFNAEDGSSNLPGDAIRKGSVMIEKRVKLNINDTVKVKFTEEGKRIYREYFDEGIYHEPTPDSEGYRRMQLWLVMKIFGSHIKAGFVNPIETEMEILVGVK